MIQIVCDFCKTVIEPTHDNSTYLFLQWEVVSASKQLQPVKKEENYCSNCTTKIKDALKDVKKKIV